MGRFVVRRLLFGVVVLLIISFAVFALFFLVAPGEPAANFVGKNATPEAIARVEKRYGLDKPWYEQYGLYVGRLAKGDLGYSFRNEEPVRDTLVDRLPDHRLARRRRGGRLAAARHPHRHPRRDQTAQHPRPAGHLLRAGRPVDADVRRRPAVPVLLLLQAHRGRVRRSSRATATCR